MTTLGKILAIVNLVLSVVVGAFIIMSYVARTNWHAAYNLVNAQLKVAQNDAVAYKDEVTKAQQVITSLQDAVKAKEKLVQDTQINADRQVKLERARTQEEASKTSKYTAQQGGMSAELERRQDEVRLLHASMEKYKKDLADKEKDVQTFRDRAVEMEITAKRTQEMNERLLVQLENSSKALAIQRSEGNIGNRSNSMPVNPPAEEVEGTIKEVDPQSGLVTISIGTDKGIKEGNTLDVFRLRPEASYKGTIVILNARANEAVGRPTKRERIPLQVGDRVASNVMSKRYDQGINNIK